MSKVDEFIEDLKKQEKLELNWTQRYMIMWLSSLAQAVKEDLAALPPQSKPKPADTPDAQPGELSK